MSRGVPVRQANGLWVEGARQLFTEEEVAASNSRERDLNAVALEGVKVAGFVRFPVFARNVDGELVEREAWLHPRFTPSCSTGFRDRHGMAYNIYVPSHGRAGTALTPKMLEKLGVENYYICIDPSQFEAYRKAYGDERLVIRDISFREPDLLDAGSSLRHPITMAGHAPLCNFTLALSRSLGEARFWFMDDDLKRLGLKARKGSRTVPGDTYRASNYYRAMPLLANDGFNFQRFSRGMEEVAEAVRNPGFIGLEKYGMVFGAPVSWRTGTRVYTYYLTTNATQVPHYGRQNNDIVTSLELSKHGLVNLLFVGIGYDSLPTQTGGAQTALYQAFGTLDKAKVLVRAHPKVSTITERHFRIHHLCNFSDYRQLRVVGAARKEDT